MMKKNLSSLIAITSVLAVSPMLTNCGKNLDSSASAIGYQSGTISAGCLAITGPIPFTAANIQYDPQESGQIVGGRISRTQSYPANYSQANGTVTLGGSVITGPLVGNGQMGTVTMAIASVQPNPYYSGYYGNYYGTSPQIASAVGTVTLSAAAQMQILQAIGSTSGAYGSGYGYGAGPGYGYNQYPQQFPYTQYPSQYPSQYPYTGGYQPSGSPIGNVCISSLALNLTHRGNTLQGSVEIYVNNTQYSQVLTFY
jgi:hypothetical protein